MTAIVDWLTYTAYKGGIESDIEVSAYALAMSFKPDYFPVTEPTPSPRQHCHIGMTWEGGYALFVTVSHAVSIELSGKACQALRDRAMLHNIITQNRDSVTRLDLARDHKTKATPEEVAMSKRNERITAKSFVHSSSGETYYLGSRSGERYVRIYTYFAPHPRAGLLRTEFVLKKRYAAECALQMSLGVPVDDLLQGQVVHYGFSHRDVQIDSDAHVGLSPKPVDRNNKDIRRWVVKQVAPALLKHIEAGTYSWAQFVRDVDAVERDRKA